MTEKPEKPVTRLVSGFDARGVKTVISEESYAILDKEAKNKEISKAELVRHIVYEYQEKKATQSKPG